MNQSKTTSTDLQKPFPLNPPAGMTAAAYAAMRMVRTGQLFGPKKVQSA